jgi:hypothetical protein
MKDAENAVRPGLNPQRLCEEKKVKICIEK